jgi:hypothetical protein
MAGRLAGKNVRRMHQSLHHLVADAPWRIPLRKSNQREG